MQLSLQPKIKFKLNNERICEDLPDKSEVRLGKQGAESQFQLLGRIVVDPM